METNKYKEAFARFAPAGTDREIADRAGALLKRHEQENFTPDVLKLLHGCIDLTSLATTDTKDSIWQLVNRVNDFEGERPDIPNVAAICTYPIFTETVREALTAQNVRIAAVTGGFPASQTFAEIKVAETALAVMNGAEEIDTVMNVGEFLAGNYEDLAEDIHELKVCAREATLKVILETGAYPSMADIQNAAIFAIYAGADFIKTSTGKEYAGASIEAVYTMCQVVKEYYAQTKTKIGIKISGGVRTAEEAVQYYTLVKELLGEEWLNRDYFRIGASRLVDDLLNKIGS